MEDILGIIVVAIIYLAVAASVKKKPKRSKSARASTARKTQFEQAFARQTMASKRTASERRPRASKHQQTPDCEQQRMHLHQATQQQMQSATEGEDPCHVGRAPQREKRPSVSHEPEHEPQIQEENTLAQDVLRGVIMSEILQRPCERMAIRQNKRRIS